MIAIIDYGVGNLFSLSRSLEAIGEESVITNDAETIQRAGKIILPGVGAFGDAMDKLKENRMDELVKRQAALGKPLMGICLGMQLLFEKSLEFGEHGGLSLIPGTVRPIGDVIDPGLKIPQIGWNALRKTNPYYILKDVKEGECVYFVHSYWADTAPEYIIADTEYSARLTATVANGNVCGCQFHPEKSGNTGLRILKSFAQGEMNI
ncbi:MAG: imidazole glycerol phosphate synthase subunit HisH [Clostridiales bacterium]|nr:imidazole glycerol phosphate synthase subunit HisH [Clostridiales bacterium]